MTFTVTYRGADGALVTEAVEAANRAECFAQMKARGITPMGVKEGGSVSRRERRSRRDGGREDREERRDRKGGYKSSPNRGGHERFDRSGKSRSFGKGKDFGKKRRFNDDED